MRSDLEKSVAVLFEALRDLREQMGALAWVLLGVVLVGGILMGALALRWIRRGGLRDGATRRFFAWRRDLEHWLRSH